MIEFLYLLFLFSVFIIELCDLSVKLGDLVILFVNGFVIHVNGLVERVYVLVI